MIVCYADPRRGVRYLWLRVVDTCYLRYLMFGSSSQHVSGVLVFYRPSTAGVIQTHAVVSMETRGRTKRTEKTQQESRNVHSGLTPVKIVHTAVQRHSSPTVPRYIHDIPTVHLVYTFPTYNPEVVVGGWDRGVPMAKRTIVRTPVA